jgi:hypothetical protein
MHSRLPSSEVVFNLTTRLGGSHRKYLDVDDSDLASLSRIPHMEVVRNASRASSALLAESLSLVDLAQRTSYDSELSTCPAGFVEERGSNSLQWENIYLNRLCLMVSNLFADVARSI